LVVGIKEYLMGRDITHPVSEQQLRNACDLLARVNYLLGLLQFSGAKVSSGYRPSAINSSVGGAKKSAHIDCMGIDLEDSSGYLAFIISRDTSILDICDLWLESPEYTDGWVHLDTKKRRNRIFIP
jgi:hypothetical protein